MRMFKKYLFILTLLVALNSCKNSQEKYFVEITNRVDPDIVLVNLGEVDRAAIGQLLLSINRCHPLIIGIDAWFQNEKDNFQDSVLIAALDSIENDFLAYHFDSTGKIVKSHNKFSALAKDEGVVNGEYINGLQAGIIPIRNVGNHSHKLFSLKIIEQWKPGFKTTLKTDQKIPIKFTRTLDQFFHFDYYEIDNVDCEALRNKVVLVGYLGPSNEDKHFTPIRFVRKYNSNEPDTYGLVIIANQIRTILEYGRE